MLNLIQAFWLPPLWLNYLPSFAWGTWEQWSPSGIHCYKWLNRSRSETKEGNKEWATASAWSEPHTLLSVFTVSLTGNKLSRGIGQGFCGCHGHLVSKISSLSPKIRPPFYIIHLPAVWEASVDSCRLLFHTIALKRHGTLNLNNFLKTISTIHLIQVYPKPSFLFTSVFFFSSPGHIIHAKSWAWENLVQLFEEGQIHTLSCCCNRLGPCSSTLILWTEEVASIIRPVYQPVLPWYTLMISKWTDK